MKRIIYISLLVAGLFSCTKDFEEINNNPNNPIDVSSENLMGSTMVYSSVASTYFIDQEFVNLWVQYWAQTAIPIEDRYMMVDEKVNQAWEYLYAKAMKDAQEIVRKGEEEGFMANKAIGMIMKAYNAYVLTNIWGDIPYTEALRAEKQYGGIITPKYDKQEDVYNQLLIDLSKASELLNTGNASYHLASNDLIYRGDLLKWEKFANSLQLRIYLNMSKIDAAKASAGISSLLNKPLISSNDDNPMIRYKKEGGNTNPLYMLLSTLNNEYRVSKTLIEYMVGKNGFSNKPVDPRLSVFAKFKKDTNYYEGAENGKGNPDMSEIGLFYNSADAPYFFMTYAEVLFIKAEAASKGWISEDAENLYESAIRASMEQFGVTSEEAIDDFLSDSDFKYDEAKQEELIAMQKWVALYTQGSEAYNNWRRTGFPQLKVATSALYPSIPRRVEYPTNEYANNKINTDIASQRQGGTKYSNRVWWDIK